MLPPYVLLPLTVATIKKTDGLKKTDALELQHLDASDSADFLQQLAAFNISRSCKGSIFSAHLKQSEEYTFPYKGQEHFLFVTAGSVKIQERNLGQELTLKSLETCWLSREGQTPFLDIRAIGQDMANSLFWVVLHTVN